MKIKNSKRYIKNLVIIIIFSLFFNGCGDIKTQNTVKVLGASSVYVGANYETVMMELQKAGFKYIETEEIEDLSSLSSMSDGEVEKVVIDGNMNFEKDEIFSCEAKAVVTYHAIKKITPPI